MIKNILCYGDSNTRGNIAGTFNPETMLHQRFIYSERWTGILQQRLGDHYHVIEAALNGRTTSFDEVAAARPSRNGLATLPGILDMHYPLDLVILMLGSNDIKSQFNASVDRITDGMRQLIHSSIEKSHQLASAYQKLAEEEGCAFLDIAPWVKISAKDGLHIEKESQAVLAEAIAQKVKGLV